MSSPHALFTEHGGPAVPEFRIGLAPIPLECWFEGGEADPAARKDALYRDHPDLVWGETDGSRPAQAEVAGMVAGWLHDRYLSSPAWAGEVAQRAGGGRASAAPSDNPAPVSSTPSDASRHLPRSPGEESESPPLHRAASLVADDLCLMEKRTAGWTLTAASLCAPSFFSAKDAVGKALHELHAPVPGFNTALLPRVSRIFDHLADGAILERRNWTVVNSPDLFQPDYAPYRARLPHQTPDQIADSLVVRRERQTIRRAPKIGAVLFTIRIWREPLSELLADPLRRQAFAAAWEQVMGDQGAPFRHYKRLDLFDAAIRHRLAEMG